jgi:hypothetical protein
MLGELFDPEAELVIGEHFRPHWSQAGSVVFITFRTHDSIPEEVLKRWEREKQDWVERRGHAGHWSDVVPPLEKKNNNNSTWSSIAAERIFWIQAKVGVYCVVASWQSSWPIRFCTLTENDIEWEILW